MSAAAAYKVRARVAYYLHTIEDFSMEQVAATFRLSEWRARQLVMRGERLFHEEQSQHEPEPWAADTCRTYSQP